MRKALIKFLVLSSFFVSPLKAEEENTYTINFHDVPVVEFIQFVSRISNANFIFNHRDLQFNITLASGKPVSSDHVVKALVQILRAHGMSISHEDGYLVIHKGVLEEGMGQEYAPMRAYEKPLEAGAFAAEKGEAQAQLPSSSAPASPGFPTAAPQKPQFFVYKVQYHSGEEIEETVKRITGDLASKPETSPKYLSVLKSVQWIKSTNSLVFSGDEESLQAVKQLIVSLDTQLRQVFIEVLVVETGAQNSLDFGLQWAAGGKYKNSLGMGTGNFTPQKGGSPFALNFKEVNESNYPTGPNQIFSGSGFDMGVIGDILFHKGRSFLSLGSLVSALQQDGDSSIVLNQKIITQDGKKSTIFVGENIPYTNSIETEKRIVTNVEYRDVGVNLSITPRLGEGDVITIDLNEEISEQIPTIGSANSNGQAQGIHSTKTNMMTHVHVPDKHFLVLSGMARNSRSHQKAGLPCLGGIPGLGALFSKTNKHDQKRNVIVFVRPHIIRSMEDYRKLTQQEQDIYRGNSAKDSLDHALELHQRPE